MNSFLVFLLEPPKNPLVAVAPQEFDLIKAITGKEIRGLSKTVWDNFALRPEVIQRV